MVNIQEVNSSSVKNTSLTLLHIIYRTIYKIYSYKYIYKICQDGNSLEFLNVLKSIARQKKALYIYIYKQCLGKKAF